MSKAEWQKRYDALVAENLDLNLTRGQPSKEQRNLSASILQGLQPGDDESDGIQIDNYIGPMQGLESLRALLAPMLKAAPEQLIIGGNSSLKLMSDFLLRAFVFGVGSGENPWEKGKVKFIVPVPGYDRHFVRLQTLGVQMIPVELDASGAFMDEIEELVSKDASIKGVFTVPRYSNPTGITFSENTVRRFAQMKTAASDFRVIFDDAYAVHCFKGTPHTLLSLLDECDSAGCPDRALVFGSTSKITHPGSGVGILAANKANIDLIVSQMKTEFIGPNKAKQHTLVRFLERYEGGIRGLMSNHATVIAPKFEAVQRILNQELAHTELYSSGQVRWEDPEGGYFVSVDVPPGKAGAVIDLAEQAGVKFTPAGSTYPAGMDTAARNIRLAPTLPVLADVEKAMEVFALSVLLA